MARQRTPKGLSAEDDRLWRHATETAKPLRKARPPLETAKRAANAAAVSEPARERTTRAAAPKGAKVARPAPPLAGVAAREARRIAGGRQPIDARVDLHGLRQGEAHRKLTAFLARAQAQGHRTVLVITGKGACESDREAPFWERSDRGVLKTAVPLWLAEPALRAYVVGFATAHHRHGGEGALYVRLRRTGKLP